MKESHVHTEGSLRTYHVWDKSVRIFHWINVVCILGLIAVGLVIFYNKNLGVSTEGKILLKTIHVYIGYLFALNLGWRFIWFFLGSRHARLSGILPFGKKYIKSLQQFIKGLRSGDLPSYNGHNPLAKPMVTLLFLLLGTQAATGLILAGTDLYMPPIGHKIAQWISVSGQDSDKLIILKPGSKDNIDKDAYQEMRAFRKPIITIHKYVFYTLIFAILLHIVGVIVSEIKERSGLVSAMFTGDKVHSKKPVDFDGEG
jgi:cytochrome b